MIDINDRFNVRSTISYYNVRFIKDNIYEAEAKGNYNVCSTILIAGIICCAVMFSRPYISILYL